MSSSRAIVNTAITDMLTLNPACPLNIHIADSVQMGLSLLSELVHQPIIIGIPTALIRHKIAYNFNIPVSSFIFINDHSAVNKMLAIDTANYNLILWDYLYLTQPISEEIIYLGWKQIDLIANITTMIPNVYTDVSSYLLDE
jgi:hypothetical protein